MAKKKISGLPAGSALNGTELVPIVQTGTTKRITTQDIANLGNSSGVEGSGTINTLAKFTASSTIGNSQIFDNGTNVGINTTSPAAKLDVDSTGYSIFANNSGGNRIVKIGTQSASGEPAIQATLSNGTARYLMLNPDGGNILIGTTGDDGVNKLQVSGSVKVSSFLSTLGFNASLYNAGLISYGNITNNPKLSLNSISGYTWSLFNNDVGSNGEFIIRYEEGATNALTINRNGAATFSADATINGMKVGRGAGNIATNTTIGLRALAVNTTGAQNVAIGTDALTNNTTGTSNVGVGLQTLYLNTTGNNNICMGENALFSNVSGNNNTAIGKSVLVNNIASNNTAVGFEAGLSNTSGTGNATNGYQTLRSNTTGSANTANGFQALYSNIVGSSNTAIGASALALNTASNNTAVGFEAGYSNTTSDISAFGYNAGRLSTGQANTFIGNYSGYITTTGAENTFVGYNAGGDSAGGHTTGNYNTAVGLATATGNFSGSLILGHGATATGNNQAVFGSSAQNAGAIATEVLVSDRSWAVRINGTAYKILLKA